MAIKFCKKCNSILKAKIENDKHYLICTKCQSKEEQTKNDFILTIKEPSKIKKGEGVAKANPKLGYNFKCPKCRNNKCELIDLGIMYGDEDWVYLLQCTKCDYGERVGEVG